MKRLFAAAVSVALVAAGVVFPIAPAVADAVDECTTSTGVLVVVDLRPFNGSLTRGCDSSPTTGRAALAEAGYQTVDVARQPGFVCRINGEPSSAPCVNTPPASAYWSYWHADRGQKTWSYSSLGASSYEPKDGSIDAWVFGATDVGGTTGGPCFSPADARAGRATSCPTKAQPVPSRSKKKSTPKPTRERSATAGVPAGAPRPASSAAGTTTPSAAAGSRAASSAPGSSTAAASTSAAATSSAVPTIVDASQAAADRNDSGGGSATPVFLGLGLALVLGAGAWFAMRRRRAEPEL